MTSISPTLPSPMNAAEVLLVRAAGDPAPALFWRETSVSYDQLAGNVARAAAALAAQGLACEQRVALLLKDYPGFVYAYLGAIWLGAVPIAVNLRATGADIAHVLQDGRARVLIVDREFVLAAHAGLDRVTARPAVVFADAANPKRDAWLALVESHAPVPAARLSPDDMAFWIYTSGTTGAPKAAVHVHKDVLSATDYPSVLGLARGDTVLATSKLFFAYALGNVLFAPLLKGASAVLLDEWPDPLRVAAAIERHRPQLVFSVPTLFRNMLETGVAAAPAFRNVRHFISAGERLPEELWSRWKQATGVEIIDGMGTSETIYMLLTNRPGEVRPGSSGKPAPGVECRLCDAEGMPAKPGEPGILWAKIASRADRYWNAQAKSQAAFRGEWFRSGDVYAIDEQGYWFHQGRNDDMLKISGQWVSPAEIEEVALAQPALSDACALGLPDADGLPRLALFVVPRAAGADELTLSENLRAAIKRELAPYKVPKWIRCVPEIPRTATGKAQRFRLRDLYGADPSNERRMPAA